MRIPLIRAGGDDTPIAWWEWLFYPVVLLGVVAFLLAATVLSVPGAVVVWLIQRRAERRLRERLAAAGQFLDWPAVASRLAAGEGTLIVEYLSPKGPVRAWWTPDDLPAAAPGPLPPAAAGDDAHTPELREYARACAARYTDPEAGSAYLTAVPPRGRRPDRRVPPGRVVALFNWFGDPSLTAGDAEDVFLASS